MDKKKLSLLNCDKRLKYNNDKNMCENLNPDKINNFLNNILFFDKNKYLLDHKKETLYNLSKEECADYSIEKDYKGFNYNGNKNMCLIYDSYNLKENNYSDIYDKNYNNKKTFLKNKNNTNIYNNDQLDVNKYFNITNHKKPYKNNIDKIIVNNENECLEACLNNYDNKCKGVTYMEINKECNFYNNLKHGINNEDYDNYSLNKETMKTKKNLINNLLNYIDKNNNDKIYNYCTLDNNECILTNELKENEEVNTKVHTYNCGGIDSTDPFCIKKYSINDDILNDENNKKDKYSLYTDCFEENNYNENDYNMLCKSKFGNEYVFDDNIYNMENKIKCDDEGIMIKCKLKLEDKNILEDVFHKKVDKIEHFENGCINEKCSINNDKSLIPKNCIIVIFLVSIFLIILLGIIL